MDFKAALVGVQSTVFISEGKIIDLLFGTPYTQQVTGTYLAECSLQASCKYPNLNHFCPLEQGFPKTQCPGALQLHHRVLSSWAKCPVMEAQNFWFHDIFWSTSLNPLVAKLRLFRYQEISSERSCTSIGDLLFHFSWMDGGVFLVPD